MACEPVVPGQPSPNQDTEATSSAGYLLENGEHAPPHSDRYTYRIIELPEKPRFTAGGVHDTKSILLPDQPPLFGFTCLEEKLPERCSNRRLRQFIREHLRYPTDALAQQVERIEYVTFHLDRTGKLAGAPRILSRGSSCTSCKREALRIVEQLPQWKPALFEGQPVEITITLPIHFRISDI